MVEKTFECVEPFVPKLAVALEPVGRRLQRAWHQRAVHDAALLFARHEAGALEDRDVFHEAGQRHRERLRQFAGRRAATRQARHDGAPCRVSQRGERDIERLIVNHLV